MLVDTVNMTKTKCETKRSSNTKQEIEKVRKGGHIHIRDN